MVGLNHQRGGNKKRFLLHIHHFGMRTFGGIIIYVVSAFTRPSCYLSFNKAWIKTFDIKLQDVRSPRNRNIKFPGRAVKIKDENRKRRAREVQVTVELSKKLNAFEDKDGWKVWQFRFESRLSGEINFVGEVEQALRKVQQTLTIVDSIRGEIILLRAFVTFSVSILQWKLRSCWEHQFYD